MKAPLIGLRVQVLTPLNVCVCVCCVCFHRTHLSYGKSVQAVSGLLELLKEMVPQCEAMMDGLLSAVQKSYVSHMICM